MKEYLLSELTVENVGSLTPKEIAQLLNFIETEPDRDKRATAIRTISAVYDLRSVSMKSNGLKNDLIQCGYEFFSITNNGAFIRGIRKRTKE